MVIVDRKYAGAAAQATLLTAMTPSTPSGGGTITVSDDSGYPTGGKFEIVVDRGQSNEESILISSRSGTTFTIGNRGYDGTVANTHTSGVSLVEHELSAQSVQLFVDHVDDVEAAPHSTKLPVGTTAGHDTEARHTFGAALGTPVTPTALTPDIAGAAGTGNNPSREDHVHNVPAGTPVSVGTALAESATADFARAGHVHDLANALGTTPTAISPDDTQSGGSALTASKNDHRHAITAGTPAALTKTASSSESAGSGFARDVHVHATSTLPWGIVDRQDETTSGSALGAGPVNSDFLLSSVVVDSTRLYKVYLHSRVTFSTTSEWEIMFTVDGTETLKLDHRNAVGSDPNQQTDGTAFWEPTSGTKTLRVSVTRASGGGTLTFSASAAAPRQFWVEDIGLR